MSTNNDLSSYFEEPEFKNILAKYEGMVNSHTPTYFDAEELTDIAEYYASRGEGEKADAAIDFALHLHPNNTDALVFKSRSLCIKGKLSEAYQVMELIDDTSDREVKFLKADLLMEERRMEEAELIHQELAELEGESFDVLMDIAMTYMDANQKEYAAKWLQKVRDKGYNETNSQKFRDVWCDYCMTFGEGEKATKAFQVSLDELPYSIAHWNGMAKCYLMQEDYKKALEAIDFALAIDENNQEALEVKGYCYLQTGKSDEALEVFHNMLPTAPMPGRIYALLLKCYMDMDRLVEAKDICFEWLKNCPKLTGYEKSEIYSYIAMCLFNLHEPKEGMKYIDMSLALEPCFRGAILQKGMFHLQLSEEAEAQKLFQKVYDMSPDDEQVDVLYNVANCYFFLQLYPQTIKWSKRIVEEYPDDQMEALYLIAASYFYMFDFDSTKVYLNRIYELGNNSFDQEFLNDKRFQLMFASIVQSKYGQKE